MSIPALTITRPDDWHLHLRDGAPMASVVGYTAERFGRAIVMPNLKPPVTTTALALAYQGRILAALPEGSRFEPLMTLYLTDNTPPDEIKRAKDAGIVALKLYPAGATTNSNAGVTDIRKCYRTLDAMQREGLLLLVHGEVTDSTIDVFDREVVFIDRILRQLRRDFPGLKIVLEHITTKDAADFVWDEGGVNTAATITAHHLLLNRNAIFLSGAGATGLYPDNYCLPILKREAHREALVRVATSGSRKFFLGTDSAPHAAVLKDSMPSCAGCFTAPAGIELYAKVFDDAGAIDKLEGFASLYGADFYGLPRNTATLTLAREAWQLPESLRFGDTFIRPLFGGQMIPWQLVVPN